MYPLPVLRSFGKLLNPVLGKQKPFRCCDFAAQEAPQGMRAFYDQWRHGFLLEAADQCGGACVRGLLRFPSSSLATASVCTSSGPSASRRVRTLAHALARKVSCETPAAPCA